MAALKNQKQEQFAQLVAKGEEAANAYAAVYQRDVSKPATRGNASRLRSNGIVAQRIEELMGKAAQEAVVDQAQVLRELKRIGFSDVRELYDENGNVKHPKDWPDDIARAIASIEVEALYDYEDGRRIQIGTTTKVKLWPKDKALDMMARHLPGFYAAKDVNLRNKTLEDLLVASNEED